MPIFPGDKLSSYEGLALADAGGRGEVYTVRDALLSTHKRQAFRERSENPR